MFNDRITLFTLFGFKVQLDSSWIVTALLVKWSLSTSYFPRNYRDLDPRSYWIMGLVGAVGLFASVIFHEFWPSAVTRYYGLPMNGITLFIFGGIAGMNLEPDQPKTEFLMAAASPLPGILLGYGFYGLQSFIDAGDGSTILSGLLGYLAFINYETIPDNIRYYMQRTSHGSTLSQVVHSWVLCHSDREGSWQLFKEALHSGIDDIQGGTTPEGIHLGAMAGSVDLLQRGYTGIETRGDVLRLTPLLTP